MRVAAVLLVLGLSVSGCAVTTEQRGAPGLLEHERVLAPGGSVASVVGVLGVPDAIDESEDGFRFEYHFVRRRERRFGIVGYGLRLLTDERKALRDGSLQLWFSSDGRLLRSRLHDHVRSGVL